MTSTRDLVQDERDQFAFHDDIVYLRETKRGLTRDTVEEISRFKDEPDWMLQYRLRAYDHFLKRKMPNWGGDLGTIDFDKIVYYRKPSEREEKSWDDVPEQIKATFEKLGIPEAERKFLAGVGAQYDSEVVYHSVREELSKIGVVFMGTDQALKEYPEIFRKYFGTVVPAEDNKFAALNAAVWSGGSFVYVPKGVEVPLPAPGLLPDQRREHRPVRADADRGRRGRQGPLHRGLHGPDLRDRLAARRGRRGRRAGRRQGPLHDHPELVERRLQPRDEAGARVRALDGRVGGREHRLPPDDEVPGDLPPRRGRHGRGHLGRGGRPGPAPGHRAPRPSTWRPTPRPGSSPSPCPRTVDGPPIAASCASRPAPPASRRACAATPSCSMIRAGATPTPTSTSRKTTRR